jgi:hypothetical protein
VGCYFSERVTWERTAWASPSASWLSTAPQVTSFCPSLELSAPAVLWCVPSYYKSTYVFPRPYSDSSVAIHLPTLTKPCITHPTGGIAPHRVLPVMLDVGTNNPELLKDPAYVGIQRPRLVGDAYYELVDEFMQVRWTVPMLGDMRCGAGMIGCDIATTLPARRRHYRVSCHRCGALNQLRYC